jgi:hypothetical protein
MNAWHQILDYIKNLNIKLACYSTKKLKIDMGYIVLHG